MSNATVIVALSPENLDAAGGDVEEAVRYQMEPFEETDVWFADGTRWDSWLIGGHYAGQKFPSGAITQRSELTSEALQAHNVARANALWDAFEREERKADLIRCAVYGLEDGETRQDTIDAYCRWKLTAFVFLRDWQWYERDRLDWGGFGPTECHRRSIEETGEDYTGRCIYTDERTGARIVSFAEDEPGDERWDRMYWPRFIRNLPPDTTLVGVHYHV